MVCPILSELWPTMGKIDPSSTKKLGISFLLISNHLLVPLGLNFTQRGIIPSTVESI